MSAALAWPPDVSEFIEANSTVFDQSLPWLECFQQQILGTSEHIFFIADRSKDAALQAVLPLVVADIPLVGKIKHRALTAPTNYYSALFAPICAPGSEDDSAPRLASKAMELARDLRVFDLNPLAENTPFLDSCHDAFREGGWFTEIYPRFGNWVEPIGGRSFPQFLTDRPGRVRSTLARKGKKLRSQAKATLRIVTELRDVDDAMDQYEAIYRSSWKSDEPFKGFIRGVVRQFAQRGWLRLGIINLNGVPAAAQIWFVYRDVASIFKLAYDSHFSDLSLGSLLTAHLFEHVVDVDRVNLVDYLCGDDEYKKDWMTVRRQRVGFRAVRQMSLPGVIEGSRRAAKRFDCRKLLSRRNLQPAR